MPAKSKRPLKQLNNKVYVDQAEFIHEEARKLDIPDAVVQRKILELGILAWSSEFSLEEKAEFVKDYKEGKN